MKRYGFSEGQIIGILREHDAGAKAGDLPRKLGISEATPTITRRSLVRWMSLMPSGYAPLRKRTTGSNSFWPRPCWITRP